MGPRKQKNVRIKEYEMKTDPGEGEMLSPSPMDGKNDSHGDSDDPDRKPIKKRKYSRGGCQECKRRKMKCDEGKPFCHNCTRLKKTCVYEPKAKFKESQAKSSQSSQSVSPRQDSAHSPNLSSTTAPQPAQVRKQNSEGPKHEHQEPYVPQIPMHNQIPSALHPTHSPSDRYMQQQTDVPSMRGPLDASHFATTAADSPPVLPPPQVAAVSPMSFPSMSPMSFPSIRTDAASSHVPALTAAPPKSSFRNAISDILSPSDGYSLPANASTVPGALASALSRESPNGFVNPHETKTKEMQDLFDEASLLVSDINHLVSVDLALQNHNLYNSDESMLRHAQAQNAQRAALAAANLNGSSSHHPPQSTTRSNHSVDSTGSHRSSGSFSSENFDRHNFQIDDFTDRIHNGHSEDSLNDYDHDSIGYQNRIVEQMKLTNSELIEETIIHNNLVGPHITYLKTLTSTDLSYHLFPFASSIENNEAVKLLLMYSKNCPYLLTSLLAISATFQYNQTGKKVHDLTRQKYISVCLRSLSDAFANDGGDSDRRTSHLTNDIEKLLLTVLVLTSNFTATAYTQKDNLLSSWKIHLRGAKDLLVRYSKVTKKTNHNQGGITPRVSYMSGGLALAKIWFFAIESLAALHTPLGGTLTKNKRHSSSTAGTQNSNGKGYEKVVGKFSASSRRRENVLSTDTEDDGGDGYNRAIFFDTGHFNFESNPDYHDALVRIGLQTSYANQNLQLNSTWPTLGISSEFNLFVGNCMSYVYLIQEFIGALDTLRLNNYQQLSSNRIAKLVALVHAARQSQVAPQVKKKSFIIPTTSPAHPEYRLALTKIIFPHSGYAKSIDAEGDTLYYSWFDLSHHVHVDAIYLRIMVTPGLLRLPHKHPLVQELVQNLIDSMFFIRSKDSHNSKDEDDSDKTKDTEHHEESDAREEDASKHKDNDGGQDFMEEGDELYRRHKENGTILAESEHYYLPKDLFDNRCIMLQTPYRMCAGLVEDEQDFERIELFFLGLVKLGNGSSLASLDVVTQFKERARKNGERNPDEKGEHGSDSWERDIIGEIEAIPFA